MLYLRDFKTILIFRFESKMCICALFIHRSALSVRDALFGIASYVRHLECCVTMREKCNIIREKRWDDLLTKST